LTILVGQAISSEGLQTPCPVKKETSSRNYYCSLLSVWCCSVVVFCRCRGAQAQCRSPNQLLDKEEQHSVHCWPFWKEGGDVEAQFEQVMLAWLILRTGSSAKKMDP